MELIRTDFLYEGSGKESPMAVFVPIPDVEISETEKRILRIRAYKERMNYTFKDIAEKSGVPLSTVKKVLTRATAKPRRQTVEQIEKSLGIRYGIHNAAEANGELYAQAAPDNVSGTSAEKLDDLIPSVEAGIEEHLRKNGQPKKGNVRKKYTIEDYYRLPDECRVELIDGVFYDMAAPTSIHQYLIGQIVFQIQSFIQKNKGKCIPFMAPLDVQLDCDDYTMMQPDILIVCDSKKLIKRCLMGAPDYVCEIISPSDRYGDRLRRQVKFHNAGVREYWEVYPDQEKILVYYFESTDADVEEYSFSDQVPVNIYDGKLKIDFRELAETIKTFGE